MQSSVETLSPTRVRLTIEAPFDELKPELDKAYREIGKQVRVQGFRPGKVPPRILDQRVGRGAVLEQAVQEAVPRLYTEAMTDSGLTPVAQPEVEVTELADGDRLAFTAEVDVRPEITVPSYDGLAVTVDAVEVSDSDIDEQVDALRERFASLKDVDRPAAEGDFVTLDLVATIDGEEVPGGTATGLSYQIGSGQLLEGIDEAVTGASAGESRTFQTVLVAGEHEGRTADVAVTVQAVQERELPEADDAWASQSTGFETFAALREDVATRLDRVKRMEQGVAARDKVLEALLAQVDVPLPQSVVDAELSWRRQATEEQLQRNGVTLQGYLDSEGTSQEDFEREMREGTEQAVKAQLVLDAIADREELGVSDAELTDQVVRRAARAGMSPDQYAQQLVQSGQLAALMSEVRRGKALATVMEAATITDSKGDEVDLERLRDASASPEAGVEVDEAGRPYHVHDDGSVHYLDEQ